METLHEKIKYCADELTFSYGEYDGDTYYSNSIIIADQLPINYEQIVDINRRILDEDHKNKRINGMQKKIIKLELKDNDNTIKINELELKDKEKIIQINKLETTVNELNKSVNYLLQKEYVMILWQAYKNLEYYIIQKVTNYADEKMNTINTNLTEFCNNPANNKYINKINELYEQFNIHQYSSSLGKINRKRLKVAHPSPIEMAELKSACDTLKKDYSGIEELYNKYEDVYNYFC